MANKKIQELNSGTELKSTDFIPIASDTGGGSYVTQNVTGDMIKDFINVPEYETETAVFFSTIDIPKDATIYYPGTPQEITGINLWTAVDTFVKTLKAIQVWNQMDIIYPFIGGTAFRHQFNLRNPSLFLPTYVGGITHSATGVKSNGINGVIQTGYSGLFLTTGDHNTSIYVRENAIGNHNFSLENGYFIKNASNSTQTWYLDGSVEVLYPNNQIGLFGINELPDRVYFVKNGAIINLMSAPYIAKAKPFSLDILGSTGYQFSTNSVSFFSTGRSMAMAQSLEFYKAVQILQTSLNRQV